MGRTWVCTLGDAQSASFLFKPAEYLSHWRIEFEQAVRRIKLTIVREF